MLNFSTPVVDLGKFNWELSAAERCEGFFRLSGFVLGVLKKRRNKALTFCIIKIINYNNMVRDWDSDTGQIAELRKREYYYYQNRGKHLLLLLKRSLSDPQAISRRCVDNSYFSLCSQAKHVFPCFKALTETKGLQRQGTEFSHHSSVQSVVPLTSTSGLL